MTNHVVERTHKARGRSNDTSGFAIKHMGVTDNTCETMVPGANEEVNNYFDDDKLDKSEAKVHSA